MPLWPEIGVKEGVECRKEKQAGARNIGGRMIIDKPAEEEAGDDADGDNGGDDSKRGTFSLVVSVVMAVRQRS
jgi:hypothetical protein